MKNTRMFGRLLMVAIPLALAAPIWASICPGNPTTVGLNTLIQPPASNPNGCTVGNIQFSNFVVGTDAGDTINGLTLNATNTVTPPEATAVLLTTSLGAFPGINLSPFPVNAPGGKGFCKSNSGSAGWCVQGANQSLASSVTYLMTGLGGATINSIDLSATVDVHASGSGSSLGASALVFLEACPGAASFSQGCGGYQVLQVGLFNAKFQTLTQGGFVPFSATTQVAIRETVYLFTHNGTGSFADVDSFDTTTPEPATLGLVGLALAGLGVLRVRKRNV